MLLILELYGEGDSIDNTNICNNREESLSDFSGCIFVFSYFLHSYLVSIFNILKGLHTS